MCSLVVTSTKSTSATPHSILDLLAPERPAPPFHKSFHSRPQLLTPSAMSWRAAWPWLGSARLECRGARETPGREHPTLAALASWTRRDDTLHTGWRRSQAPRGCPSGNADRGSCRNVHRDTPHSRTAKPLRFSHSPSEAFTLQPQSEQH